MKMGRMGFLAMALLSISITSCGAIDQVFADTHNIPPISASTELPSYEDRDRVVINGSIKDYDSDKDAGKDITLIINSPDNTKMVHLAQISPKSDGTFTHSFIAGGALWKQDGAYTINLNFNSQKTQLEILFTSAESAPPPVTCGPGQELRDGVCIDMPPPPPPPVTCGPGQELRDGVCIDMPPPPPPPVTCGPGQELRDGVCIDMPPPPPTIVCGDGTQLVDGTCVPIIDTSDDMPEDNGGGCLIATAAYGSEMAPQVQFLREIRDNTVMSTSSGIAFMTAFNQMYYSFSPAIADLERENPAFRDMVRTAVTPMISTLSIMTLADPGSEAEVLGLGISIIMLNLGMYVAVPALIGFKVCRHFKSINQC